MFLLATDSHPVIEFKPSVEIRSRYESRFDRDFNKTVEDTRRDVFTRLRASIDFTYGKNVSGRIQYRYAHDAVMTDADDYTTDRSDVELAYVTVKDGAAKVTFGRQHVITTGERIMGMGKFGNVSKVYEGIRFTNKRLDVFGGRLAIDTKLYPRAWASFASYKSKFGQTQLTFKQDEAPEKDLQVWALSHLTEQKLGDVKIVAEGAVQSGYNQNKDVEGFMFHTKICKPLSKTATAFIGGHIASGGSSNKVQRTWDSMFGAFHANFGHMDLTGLRNLQHFMAGIDFKPNSRLDFQLMYNYQQLFDKKDGWYGAGGSINKTSNGGKYLDPTGQSGRFIGQEIDLTGNYQMTKDLQLSFGASLFMPGTFVKSFQGGNHANHTWFYIGVTGKF